MNWLPNFVIHRSWAILAATCVLTAGLAVYAALRFNIETDFDALISPNLRSQRKLLDFEKRFPQMNETLILVVEGNTPEKTAYARDFLADRFREHPNVFHSVFAPGGNSFYQHNGLLYLDSEALTDLTDRLAEVQPFLGLLAREFSLSNFFGTMSQIVTQSGAADNSPKINRLLGQMADTMDQAAAGQTDWMSWQVLMGEEQHAGLHQELILLQPVLDNSGINPVQTAFSFIKKTRQSLPAAGLEGVSVGTTGELALKAANLNSVKNSLGIAALISFILVAATLFAAFQSLWLIGICLAVLIVGLIWTLGFAMAVIGHLNIMSATFVVLFIGLGIDYSIQYCLRYKELIRNGSGHVDAIRRTTYQVGGALFLCSITTAIGFFAFVPTSYVGASELGFISGVSMFIILATNLTVLPALLRVRPFYSSQIASQKGAPRDRVKALPARFPKAAVAMGLLACIGGAVSIPWIYFDFNPLNLNDPGSEAVRTAQKLLQTPENTFWTMSVMAGSAQEAGDVARQLEKLPTVAQTRSILDMLPKEQTEKIEMIHEMAFFLPQFADNPLLAPKRAKTMAALGEFRGALSDAAVLSRFPAADRLTGAIDRLLQRARQGDAVDTVLGHLNTAILLPLKVLLVQLDHLMHPRFITLNDLPPRLIEDFVAHGQYRVQILPRENLDNLSAMERFVNDVQRTYPGATGAPAGIVGAGRAISQAFRQAFFSALAVIIAFLALVTRSAVKVALIVFPLAAGLGMTVGTTVLLGIPFNFANIIVLPLLLGIGIDYPLHLVHRYAFDPSARQNILRASTARAILFSALTTIASFGSLSCSSHRGMAGMGVMLTICITFMTLATLVLLPALAELFGGFVQNDGQREPDR